MSTSIVYNKISKHFNFQGVIVEACGSKAKLIRRRIKRLGFFTVFGQICFKCLIVPFLKVFSKKRRSEIIKEYDLNDDPNYLNDKNCIEVESVNDDKCIDALKRFNPDLVIVNGTKIISEKVLNSIDAIFINMHAGITPKYRGAHGAYWALYNKDLHAMPVPSLMF